MVLKAFRLTHVALICFSALYATAIYADCSVCLMDVIEFRSHKKKQEAFDSILKKNQKVLNEVQTTNPSMAVKLKSNIILTSLQLQTEANNAEALVQEITKKGCTECNL